MSLFTVVQRILDKAGTAFIEPRREDGHGSSALTPSFVNTGLTTQTDALTRAELDAAPVVVETGLTQPTTPADTQPVEITDSAIIPRHVTTASAGETVIATPAAGKAIRLWWYSLTANADNSATVVAGLRFGTGGTDFFKQSLSKYGQGTAHSFKSGASFHQGAVNQPLIVNLDSAQIVYANIDYEEVTP